jgi:outer membrane receptor protein involved in Fe transport
MRNILSCRIAIILLFLLCISSTTFSQSKTRISGSLQDSADKKPVGWATVGLYKSTNTQKPLQNIFSGGKGRFEFAAVDTGNYKVIITYTGYLEKEIPVRVDSGKTTLVLETILLSPAPKDLGNVVVTAVARKPLLEQSDEKLIYNTEADPSVEGLTAIDVFRKTPFLSVDGEDNVQLNGQSNFKVLLNGKETPMFAKNLKEALKSFPANLIRKIEVITNPSSKYDGEGIGGVINIITKKKVMGYNGNAGMSFNSLDNYNGSINLNFKYGKIGLTGYYGMGGNRRTPESLTSGELESLHPVAFYKRYYSGKSHGNYFYNYGNIELSWDIDSLNTASFYTDINGGKGATLSSQRYDVVLPNLVDTITTHLYDDQGYSYPGVNFGVDYIRKFKGSEEKELSFKIYRENSKDDAYGIGEQVNPGYTRYILNDNKSTNKQLTLQSDLVLPMKKGRKLEMGIKAILRRAVSDYISFTKYDPAKEYEQDEANSNSFNYHQDVLSVYSTYLFKWKDISFKMGGRLERTGIDGNFVKTSTRVEQDYYTLLPNIFLSRKFNKIHTLTLSYGKRLRRPYIWDLNPFVYNTDSLNISYGNPDLGADIIHTVEAGYTVLKGNTNINIRLGENFSNRQITRYRIFDEATGVTSTIVQNAGIARTTGLAMNISTKFTTKWSINLNSGLRYTFLTNRYRPEQKNQGMSGFGSLSTSYQLTKKWTVSGNFNYHRSEIQLQGTNGRFMFYGFSSTYKFFKDKISLSVHGNNIFGKYLDWERDFADDNFRRYDFRQNIQRAINLSLRWNFGKLSENVSRKRGVTNDDIGK